MAKKLGVHGLVQNKSGLYLVMKRSELDVDEANCWDLVGGSIEDGESVEAGFKREVQEEAGVEVNSIKVILAYTWEDKGLRLTVSARTKNDNIALSAEHNDYKWLVLDELLAISPVSLHLKAVQYMLKNKVEIVKYEEYK